MHFQIIKDEYYEIFIEALKSIVTELSIEDLSIYESDESYLILSLFARLINQRLDDEDFIRRAFAFVDFAFERGGYSTKDAIMDHIFDNLVISSKMVELANTYLKGDCLETFKKYV